jgi:hypothetical protein
MIRVMIEFWNEQLQEETLLSLAGIGICSGDRHLRVLKEYQGIVALSPAEFIAFFEAK